MSAAAVALCLLLCGGSAAAPEVAAELSRLEGQRVQLAPDGRSYDIEDVAGEGAPLVGVVEKEGSDLFLVTESGAAFLLEGPLAIPRIAGPGYKVWVLGTLSPLSMSIRARRLGVLAPPDQSIKSASWVSTAPKPCTSAPPGT